KNNPTHSSIKRAYRQNIVEAEQSNSKTNSGLSGEEAKRFYENLMKGEEAGDGSKGAVSKKAIRRVRAVEAQQGQSERNRTETGHTERSVELLGLRLLRFAHEGDISGIKEVLSKGVDINYQDTFFWTAVMCASWSGQRAAVRLLLQHGAAWVGVVDTQGRDAKDLALEAGHNEVLEELLSYRRIKRETPSDSRFVHSQLYAVLIQCVECV
uniref:Uncharacterized protein n=1 Tax=Amphilophus citrinellus TaxID=61819 RepID=A0A3Q0SEX9_AMPCI